MYVLYQNKKELFFYKITIQHSQINLAIIDVIKIQY